MLSTRGLSDTSDFFEDDKLTDSRFWSFKLAQIRLMIHRWKSLYLLPTVVTAHSQVLGRFLMEFFLLADTLQ